MNNLDLLTQAIREKRQISFEYNKPGKTPGQRIGNPYAIFILTAKSGAQSTKVHLVQTAGVSDSKDISPFPDFRMFNIQELSNIILLDTTFKANSEKYNPSWEGYKDVIAKV
ncbi:WYL domain-containing protein [uncultured Maribacter sp.]|uniref:WYL domain-containing protein n=1 Tax=uncultured Maribacter sp. TaxID=431308 RepID=UPI00261FCE4D|nr:WYL domain-containing protein [uncultured Maribacter sp.]